MCKYCKMETLNESIGEKSTMNVSIGVVKNGNQVFEAYLNRYVIEDENYHKSSLVLAYDCEIDGGLTCVKEKRIKIKYCPFCGEEL